MHDLKEDLVFGMRMLCKTPAVTSALMATVAVGIAANSIAFSVINSFFIRPLPVREPERLVRIYSSFARGHAYFTVSYPDYADIRSLTTVFTGVVVDEPVAVSLGVPGATERVWGSGVSGNYFSVLGVSPALGRFFSSEETSRSGGDPIVILSYDLWQRRFEKSRGVLDGTVLLNRKPCQVIGVAPKGFRGLHHGLVPELWLLTSEDHHRGHRRYFSTARLGAGIGVDQARAALGVLARRLQDSFPDTNQGIGFTLLPEVEGRIHPTARGGLLGFSGVLIAVAALLLAVACANVAGVLLVRGSSRRREIGARLALGATRGRIIRQLLTEGALLSFLGGALGLALAWALTTLLSSIQFPTRVPVRFDVGLDAPVLGFSVAVAALAAISFGLAPALEASKSDLITVLKECEGARAGGRLRWRGALVGAQVAVSTMLFIGAGLFLRSFENARRVELGFDPDGVVLTSLDLGLEGYGAAEARQFWRRLVDRLAALPGTQSVSLASAVPFELNITTINLTPEGTQVSRDAGSASLDFAIVHWDYFQTLRIPLLEGRDFIASDTETSSPVVIVNEVLARRFWPGMSAVGKRVTTREGRLLEVVGVAREGKYLTLGEEPKPYVYLPLEQSDARTMTLLVRTSGEPGAALRAVGATVEAMDDAVPPYNATTMSRHVDFALFPARGGAAALSVVSVVALTLMALGLYGTIAHTVERRTFEIGLRRALGAQDAHVVVLVVRQSLIVVLAGVVIGVILGSQGSRLLRGLLYGVEAADPLLLSLAPIVLVLVSVLATSVPAHRAVRMDASRALRYE